MLRHARLLALTALVTVLALSAVPSGQSRATGPVATEFSGLHFRSIGPASMSGRVSDLAVYEPNPSVYYVATAHGGVWKTTNNGTTFEAQFQSNGLIATGAVAVSHRDSNLVWLGTGESNNRQSTSWGDGVYKSTDGGRSWRHMGLPESRHINRIVMDRDDNNIVFVGATGPLFGPGGDRGLYKTADGGTTWKKVISVDADTGVNDVVQSVTDRRVLYASTYQRRRVQCCMNGGGPGSGIWKSTDLGETWTRLPAGSNGLPAGPLGRIGLDVYRRSSNILYALVEAEGPAGGGRGGGGAAGGGAAGRGGAGAPGGGAIAPAAGAGGGTGLYRSDDGGTSWRRVSASNPRPMYFSQVRIDGNSPDRIYLGGVGLHMSVDGGATMGTDAAFAIHDDIHAIWINPANPDHILIGGDGGVSISYDMARTWVQMPNLPLALFYHVSVDMDTPYNVCGGLQDNYNWCGPSATRLVRGIRNSDWFQVQGGDGFVAMVDTKNPRIVYSESQDGNIQRKNMVTGESRNIRPNFTNSTPPPAEGALPFRWNWDTPMVFSPHDGGLIVAANKVFRSNDRGDSWAVISPDLTTNADREEITTMGLRGSEIRIARNDGISMWGTIVSLAESPRQAGLYYTGTDDGVVSTSRDAGKTWTRITANLPGFPAGAWVSEVVPSRHDAGTVYVTVDAHRLNDYNTYMWASSDFGATFRSINANLRGESVKTLTEDPRNADVLYIGTETGLFLTLDRGQSWKRLSGRNFPTVRVDEIAIHPRDNAMIVGTHGRAVWILDHLEPIQEYAAAQAADAKLFSIGPAVEFRMKDDQNDEFWGHQFFVGENPPADAVIQFHLKRAVGEVRLKITDALGKDVRELVGGAGRNQPGIQTICWDFRVQPLPSPGGAAAQGGRGGGGGGGGRGGPAGAPGAPMPLGSSTPLPDSGYMPFNPCGGGSGGFGGGGFGGGGAATGPLVLPGTYNVTLMVDGKAVETKPMRVSADPSLAAQMTDVQQKRYYDMTMDLHDMQRRGMEMTTALGGLFTQMTDLAGKIKGMANVPDAVKAQFEALNKELDAVRPRFGVPPPAPGAAPAGGRGGGFGGGAPAANPADLVSRAGNVKAQILSFQDNPSDTLVKQYNDVKLALPRAMLDANAFLMKAMTLSQTLKKHDVALTVPAPVK